MWNNKKAVWSSKNFHSHPDSKGVSKSKLIRQFVVKLEYFFWEREVGGGMFSDQKPFCWEAGTIQYFLDVCKTLRTEFICSIKMLCRMLLLLFHNSLSTDDSTG